MINNYLGRVYKCQRTFPIWIIWWSNFTRWRCFWESTGHQWATPMSNSVPNLSDSVPKNINKDTKKSKRDREWKIDKMNFRSASFIIVALLALSKVLSVYWIFVIVSCVCLVIFTIVGVFFVTLAKETSVKKKLSRNPLDEHKIHTRIGINCKLALSFLWWYTSMTNPICSSRW